MIRIFALFTTLFIASFAPAYCSDKYLAIQMLRKRIEMLQSERTEKYDELVKCQAATDKFTIAGVSAMSAASIGFEINNKLQAKLNKLDARGGGTMPGDNRSDDEKCRDMQSMFCDLDEPAYDETMCEMVKAGDC